MGALRRLADQVAELNVSVSTEDQLITVEFCGTGELHIRLADASAEQMLAIPGTNAAIPALPPACSGADIACRCGVARFGAWRRFTCCSRRRLLDTDAYRA